MSNDVKNNTVEEHYKLPSLGKLYNVEVNPEVTLRPMTTNEEMKRLSKSESVFKTTAGIIDDCIVNDIGISAYDLYIGDYEYLLHKLRSVTYGSMYKMTITCPYCFYKFDDEINLDEFPVNEYTEEFNKMLIADLPKSGDKISLNYQTPRLLDRIDNEAKEYFKKTKKKDNQELLYTLKYSIDTVNGEKLDAVQLENYVKNMHMADTHHILNQLKQLNAEIGLQTDLSITCDNCESEFLSPFRFTSEFFGPTNY